MLVRAADGTSDQVGMADQTVETSLLLQQWSGRSLQGLEQPVAPGTEALAAATEWAQCNR